MQYFFSRLKIKQFANMEKYDNLMVISHDSVYSIQCGTMHRTRIPWELIFYSKYSVSIIMR